MLFPHYCLCVPPGRLGPNEIEIGLGIHGEPGVRRVPWMPVDQLVPTMVQQIVEYSSSTSSTSGKQGTGSSGRQHLFDSSSGPPCVAVMINNLGGSPPMEMYVVVNEVLRYLKQECKVCELVCFVRNMSKEPCHAVHCAKAAAGLILNYNVLVCKGCVLAVKEAV